MALVEDGLVPAFTVPSAGKYGSAVRVLLSEVLQKQDEWRVAADRKTPKEKYRTKKTNGRDLSLRHFPELNDKSNDQEISGQAAAKSRRHEARRSVTAILKPASECQLDGTD